MAGFELTLRRKVSHYIITYYLPSGMFVIVSWISFLVPPEIVPGRMTLLVTVFLVLVNIFNTITTNIPKAEGLTGKQKMKMIKLLAKAETAQKNILGITNSDPWPNYQKSKEKSRKDRLNRNQ